MTNNSDYQTAMDELNDAEHRLARHESGEEPLDEEGLAEQYARKERANQKLVKASGDDWMYIRIAHWAVKNRGVLALLAVIVLSLVGVPYGFDRIF